MKTTTKNPESRSSRRIVFSRFQNWKNLRDLRKQETQVLEEFGCVVKCRECGNILNADSESFVSDTDLVRYSCSKCETKSAFLFDTPVIIPLHEDFHNKQENE